MTYLPSNAMCVHGCGTIVNTSNDEVEPCSPNGPYMHNQEHTPERCQALLAEKLQACNGDSLAADPSKWPHKDQIEVLREQVKSMRAVYDAALFWSSEKSGFLVDRDAALEKIIREKK